MKNHFTEPENLVDLVGLLKRSTTLRLLQHANGPSDFFWLVLVKEFCIDTYLGCCGIHTVNKRIEPATDHYVLFECTVLNGIEHIRANPQKCISEQDGICTGQHPASLGDFPNKYLTPRRVIKK